MSRSFSALRYWERRMMLSWPCSSWRYLDFGGYDSCVVMIHLGKKKVAMCRGAQHTRGGGGRCGRRGRGGCCERQRGRMDEEIREHPLSLSLTPPSPPSPLCVRSPLKTFCTSRYVLAFSSSQYVLSPSRSPPPLSAPRSPPPNVLHFAVSPLCVRRIPKRIEAFL
jgi:hypothetical protein